MDYIFPDKIASMLKKPSPRTQLEASLIGISLILIGTIGIAIYFVFFSDMSLFFRIAIGLSSFGVFLFQFSTLASTYIQYHSLKLALGLYPKDKKLEMKVLEAKEIIKELNKLIESIPIEQRS